MRDARLATLCVTVLTALALAGPVAACSLPADPYVVVKVSRLAVDAIQQPSDFEDNPAPELAGQNDPLTGKDFVRIQLPEDQPLHFITLWDLTQGGTDPDPLGKLPAAMRLEATAVIGRYSLPGEKLLPVSYYFKKISTSGKVSFKLSEMVSRSGRSFEDPLSVVDIGGFVKDGEYKFNGGADDYVWNDADLKVDNAPFDKSLRSPKFPRKKEYNDGNEMAVPGTRLNTKWVVTEAKYKPQGLWVLDSYSNEYHMDVDNIGANVATDEDPPANDPRVKSGDYVFTYHVPSDPLAYHVIVGSALLFNLTGVVWDYKEELFEEVDKPVLDGAGNPVKDANNNPVMQKVWQKAPDDPNERGGSINIVGRLARSTKGLSKEVRVASLLVAVTDVTPPTHVHLDPRKLEGTTGETLHEAAVARSTPDKVTVKVIDNNPFAGRGIGPSPKTGVLFDPAKFGIDFYYAVQVYDFTAAAAGMLPTDLSVTPKFVWAKANLPGLLPTAVDTYKVDGSKVALAADAKDADASYSIASYDVPLTALDEPMGWHFATTSWDWQSGHRLKYFAVARDGSGNNQSPAPDKLPPIAAASAAAVSEDPIASKDIADAAQLVLDKSGQEVVTDRKQPPFNFPAEHPPATCPVDKLGQYGFIDVFDNDKPIVYLRVTDTKYDKKVLFGNSYAGDLRWQKARDGQKTNSNKETVDPAQKPWFDSTDWDFTEIYGDEASGYQRQAADLLGSPVLFKPAEYAATLPAGPLYGMWIDEDVPIVFDVFARDNIDWDKPDQPTGAGWGIKTARLAATPARDNDASPPNTGDCHVELEVEDFAPPEGGNFQRRKLIVHFHVMDNKLKIQSLEETRVRSATMD
ncbi:MAG: hypothetical protein HY303_00965 [Candidatus Wallbacteria bacterium]|nr:hypothetical protein [Candidatus Wallbacteria bacterium]